MNTNMYKPEGMNCQSGISGFTVQMLEKAKESGKILEATANVCDSEMALTVNLGEMTGIIPKKEAALVPAGEEVKDIAVITRVGKPVCFKVIGFEKRGGRNIAVLSRRLAQEECMRAYLMNLTPGDIIDAKITHLEPFGAFCDIGCGIVSLLPIDSVSVSRISHPRDRFYAGMEIKAVVKSIDYDTGRIYLSHKELLGTWEENAAAYAAGQTVSGIIRSIEPYGIFIELTPNLAGLAELKEGAQVGQNAAVYIKNIIPEKMKIKLALIDSCFPAVPAAPAFRYFISEGHISKWRYSPENAIKLTETDFEEEI